MAKETTKEEQLADINRHIREGIKQWADICLTADADQWAYYLDYDKDDVVNVCLLFNHVCSNIGIKKGIIGEDNAEVFGERLRALVRDMTGIETRHVFSKEDDGHV